MLKDQLHLCKIQKKTFQTIELLVKSQCKLQFVSSKRKEGTKLSKPSKKKGNKFGPEYEATNE